MKKYPLRSMLSPLWRLASIIAMTARGAIFILTTLVWWWVIAAQEERKGGRNE